jgi:membrane-associated phospholipid phosphatase
LWTYLPAAIAVVSTVVFLVLALAARGKSTLPLDFAISIALQRIDNPAFEAAMVLVSSFGNVPLNVLVLPAIVLGLWLAGSRREALFVIAAQGAALMTWLAKVAVARPRPGPDVVRVASALPDYGYPSGHVASYISLFGFLFFLVYVHSSRSVWRIVALTGLGLLVGLVGVSRIYLGYHWASDVVGGYALGTAYLVVVIHLYRTLRTKLTAPRAVESVSQPGEPPLNP